MIAFRTKRHILQSACPKRPTRLLDQTKHMTMMTQVTLNQVIYFFDKVNDGFIACVHILLSGLVITI